MLIWLHECPYEDQGLVRPLITASGAAVLMCDEGGEVWLSPDDIKCDTAIVPNAPGWTVTPTISVAPGTSRWASKDDVRALEWAVEWQASGP